ncbi:MAG TPA: alpha/beta hydrolase [Acidimicrobiales bacterium]|nr:alpha/beta hydrolase [Acidimicrobiales bacterium]
MAGRWLLKIAALAGVTFGYRAQRRRIERAVTEDDQWPELQTPVPSTAVSVTSGDGTRLHAEVVGPERAPTIVLVHGWCCAVRFWHYQLRDLAGDYRIVAYDLRGHGRSDRPANRDYSTDALAADLDAVLRACVPPEERTVVVGHSMGGMSVVAWVGAHPGEVGHRLAGVVLVDTGTGRLIAESRLLPTISGLSAVRTAAGRLALRVPVPVPTPPDPVGYLGIRSIASSRHARPAHVAFCAQMISECPPRVRTAFGVTLGRLDLVHCLRSLVVPTVVLVGSEDRLIPPPQSRAIADEVPGAALFELPGLGHTAPVEGHEEVTGHIRAVAEATSAGPRAKS